MLIAYKNKLPVVAETAYVSENVVLTGDIEIGEDSSIWFGCTLRGDVNVIRIGKRTNIQDQSMIHVSSFGHATIIGDDVTVGHMALLHACTIENGGFVGMKACLMDGVVVEEKAMVAAGSLVPPGKRIPSGELWAGSPAKFMRNLTDKDFDHMKWSSEHYVRLANEYKNN